MSPRTPTRRPRRLLLLAGVALAMLLGTSASAAPISAGIDFTCLGGCLFDVPTGFVVADSDTAAGPDGFRRAVDFGISFAGSRLDPSDVAIDPISALLDAGGSSILELRGGSLELGFGGIGIEFVGPSWVIRSDNRSVVAFGSYALGDPSRPIGGAAPEPTAALFFAAGFAAVAEATRRRRARVRVATGGSAPRD